MKTAAHPRAHAFPLAETLLHRRLLYPVLLENTGWRTLIGMARQFERGSVTVQGQLMVAKLDFEAGTSMAESVRLIVCGFAIQLFQSMGAEVLILLYLCLLGDVWLNSQAGCGVPLFSAASNCRFQLTTGVATAVGIRHGGNDLELSSEVGYVEVGVRKESIKPVTNKLEVGDIWIAMEI
ncbi:hypothetical protein F0562_017908 [Nyssa sinensis]|uniref:Uncharacterized protein n=1 Tax=Nyssa sinensis TaxID=561372 RepID=A0A5J4Z9W6_9ASTE|nr:hypothetical protein F0562_017908 [Nyssa sinensis]